MKFHLHNVTFMQLLYANLSDIIYIIRFILFIWNNIGINWKFEWNLMKLWWNWLKFEWSWWHFKEIWWNFICITSHLCNYYMQISWILYILFDSYYLPEIILEFIGFIGGLIGWKRVDDYRAIDRIGRFWSKRYGAHSFSVSSAGCFGMICHRLHFNNQKK